MEFLSFEMPVVKQSIKDDARGAAATRTFHPMISETLSNQNTEFNYFCSKSGPGRVQSLPGSFYLDFLLKPAQNIMETYIIEKCEISFR